MDKKKTKRSLLKTVAASFALILATAFFPTAAIAHAADYTGESTVDANTNRIEIGEAAKVSKINVTQGETVEIPVGVYHGQGEEAKNIGSAALAGSSIIVTYAPTGDIVKTIAGGEGTLEFVASKTGLYIVTYKVVDGEQIYSYDLEITSTTSDVKFDFTSNDENVLPTVYDTKIAQDKDVALPLPSVKGEDGEIVIDGDVAYFAINDNKNGENIENHFVYVSATSGSAVLPLNKENGKIFIDGEYLSENIQTLNGQDIKVTYSYYVKKGSAKVYVNSTSKTFTVKDGYYYLDNTKSDDKRGFEIKADFAYSVDTAVVGVPKELPSVKVTTKAENYPSAESVSAYYTIQVLKYAGNGYTEDVTAQTLVDGNNFKAKEEGSYRFVYTVKDFYGNQPTSVLSFDINNVKDTEPAKVYMYDAGDYTVEDGVYSSAENKLKTQTVSRNIVMYAIAGTDNMLENSKVTISREIRAGSTSATNTKFIIGEEEYQKAYNKYNLIFAPSKAESNSVYTQIVSDNYEIARQMIIEGEAVENEDDIKAWLLANNYLIVTTSYNKDVDGADIIDEPAGSEDEISEEDIEDMIAAGYAYIPASTTNKSYVFQNSTTYYFYYFAQDKNNGKTEDHFSVKLMGSDFTDETVPTISFASLKNVYLPNETITFNVATATDSIDKNPQVVTAYRYLNNDKETAIAAGETTLKYVVSGQIAAKDENKWYTNNGAKGLVTSDGWYVDNSKSSYSINLKNVPNGAKYVEILSVATDDYGNCGFFNQVIQIADSQDNDMPVLYKIANAPEAVDTFKAPMTIDLPTLYFSDAGVNYMTANVKVYKIAQDGTKTRVYGSNMSTTYDINRGVFSVAAGKFNASTAGNYQVAITVSDAANHSSTTYFNYNVSASESVERPEIENITSKTQNIKVNESLPLEIPTVSVTASDSYGYIGLNDDLKTANNYAPSVISGPSGYVKENEFKASVAGTYKLQYKVRLIRYEKNNANITINGQNLKYGEYFVFFDEDDQLRFNTNLLGTGVELDDKTDALNAITGYVLLSNVQTIVVSQATAGEVSFEDAYQKTQYDLNDKVVVAKPMATDGTKFSLTDSYVEVTPPSGAIAKISLDEWERAISTDTRFEVAGETIKLKLSQNGSYKIRYSLQVVDEYNAPIGDPKTYEFTIASGDLVKPEIEIGENILEKTQFAIGETIVLDTAGITISDNVTTDENVLFGNLEVKIKKADGTTKTLENIGEEGKYVYSFTPDAVGDYTFVIKTKDQAGNPSETKEISFTVTAEKTNAKDAKEILGGVLIGVSVVILAGVVIYFVVSKVKLDKKEKRYSSNGKDRK